VIDQITAAVGAALPGGEPPALDEALDSFFTTLQRLEIAPIAVIVWAEAIRDPALSQRLAGLYRGLTKHFTNIVRIGQAAGSIDPGTPAEHTAIVLTALGPAFLHQLAFGPAIDAKAFTQGLHALMRG
jgi:TetR/AcrR family transcriptional regulator, transcriptional repressor of aconitase